MPDHEALRSRLERERDAVGRDMRFMLLDHVERLLQERPPLPPVPLAQGARAKRTRALGRNVRRSLGLLPWPRRSALRAHCVGRVERLGYTVDKILFHPRPGFTVPAHLYLPTNVPRPLPGILYASGHAVEEGMLLEETQRCCIALARLGFAVLAYEAMGQGERFPDWRSFAECYVPALERSERLQGFLASLGSEAAKRHWLAWAWHCLLGEHGQLAPLLVGLSQEGLMVWESIRALDYLCTRPEVDPARLGMMGASGGGQNTYYTAALDERVRAAVVITYLPSLPQQIRTSRGNNWWGGGDLCDQVPLHLTYAEFADVGALVLPRPLLFVAGRGDDGFPIQAARDEYQRLAILYDAMAPGRLRLTEVDGPHGMSQPMREAAYGWLVRWLHGRGNGSWIPEPGADPEPLRSSCMRCLSSPREASSRSAVQQLSIRLAAAWRRRREADGTGLADENRRQSLARQIRDVLGPEPEGRLVLEKASRLGSCGELLTLRAGPEIRVLATMVRAHARSAGRPLALIVHDGGWRSAWDDGWVQQLNGIGSDVVILDTRGTGPSRLRGGYPANRTHALEEILLHQGPDGAFVTDFEITSAYLMLGRTLLGERVWDVRRFIDWIAAQPSPPASISCLGLGQGGLVAALAAVLDDRISAAGIWHGPASFHSLIVQDPAWPPSSFPFGVLKHCDLPEIAALIAPRWLTVANPRNGQAGPITGEEAARVYRSTSATYQALGEPEGFQVLLGSADETRRGLCARLQVGTRSCQSASNLAMR